jgi:glutathione S-transferase
VKLYSDDGGTAPSPRRVRVFASEKGIDLTVERLRLHEENRSDAFAQKNPLRNLPVLELDDGTCLSESVAICRYLEGLYPRPALFGETPIEIGVIEMWNRRAEISFYLSIEYAGGFLGPDVAARAKKKVSRMLALFDDELSGRAFVAGDTLSVADITVMVALDFGVRYNDIEMPDSLHAFNRWYVEMQSRASARA